MKRKDLPGFNYDAKRKRVVLDGFVPGTKCKVRRVAGQPVRLDPRRDKTNR